MRQDAPGAHDNDAAARILQLPLADMLNQPADVLKAAGIDPRTPRRLADAQARADALRTESEAMARVVRRGGVLMSRINEFAQGRENQQ